MAHPIIQHSSNIGPVEIQALCDSLHDVMISTGTFPLGGVRVRALSSDAYAIADRHKDNAFVDMVLRMGKGRSIEQKKRSGAALMSTAEACFSEALARPHFALSLEILEIDEQMSWKVNSIHSRLKGQP
jgi:5-carboxymethyl-2-hydroxymuconate isomerase